MPIGQLASTTAIASASSRPANQSATILAIRIPSRTEPAPAMIRAAALASKSRDAPPAMPPATISPSPISTSRLSP